MNIIFDLDGTLARIQDPIIPLVDANTLVTLSKKYTLCIVTGSTRAELIDALSVIGAKNIFSDTLCITATEIPEAKASGVPFIEIKKRIVGPTVMIGDSDGDEIGSKLANIPCVRVERGNTVDAQKESLLKAIGYAERILSETRA